MLNASRRAYAIIASSVIDRGLKMCTNGVNAGQFEQMIDMIDDHIKVERRWAHNMGHNAEDAGFPTVGEKLHQVMAQLDAVRALLSDAKDALEEDAESAANVQVNLV